MPSSLNLLLFLKKLWIWILLSRHYLPYKRKKSYQNSTWRRKAQMKRNIHLCRRLIWINLELPVCNLVEIHYIVTILIIAKGNSNMIFRGISNIVSTLLISQIRCSKNTKKNTGKSNKLNAKSNSTKVKISNSLNSSKRNRKKRRSPCLKKYNNTLICFWGCRCSMFSPCLKNKTFIRKLKN